MKHRSPDQLETFRKTIFAAINAGNEVKAIAIELGTEDTYVYSLLRRAGYEKMLLSPTERFAVTQMRKGILMVATQRKPMASKRGGK